MNNITLLAYALIFIVVILCCLAIVFKNVPCRTEEWKPAKPTAYTAVILPPLKPFRIFNAQEIEQASEKLGSLPRTIKITDIEILASTQKTLAELISERLKIPLEVGSVDPNEKMVLCRLHRYHICRCYPDDCYIVEVFPFRNARTYKEYKEKFYDKSMGPLEP